MSQQQRVKKTIWKRWWLWGIAGLLVIAMIGGCGGNGNDKEAADEPEEEKEHQKEEEQSQALEMSVKLIVWDDTESNAADNLEIWVKGTGSWYPDLDFGGDTKVTEPFPVYEPQELFIYPDGRDGIEIKVIFTTTKDMISGSDRDALIVAIEDNGVIITSVIIDGIEQVFSR